ncbi:hypothetical protein [Actinomadura rupiterrae]|uniref:hypothetical protein n=1 Tax=Actinomadura rupiterrae TaxID=559627 RepID=UPI0020A4BA97|nr:hypothetical protein [Actinomadura rupiterrae]MCP2339175.1 hypothetical protein [Actinomadura rupiterrae]
MSDLRAAEVGSWSRVGLDGQGRPLCPCCQEPMAEVGPGQWTCALMDAAFRQIATALGGLAR